MGRALLGRIGLLGRSSRTTLVTFHILTFVAFVPVWLFGLVRFRDLAHGRPGATENMAMFATAIMVAQILLGLVWLWLVVRRFHDQDRSGWFALVPAAVGIVAALGLPVPDPILLLVLTAYVVGLLLPGTIGPNRYGRDPRGWKSRAHYLEQRRVPGKA